MQHVHLTPKEIGQYICNIRRTAYDSRDQRKEEEEEEEEEYKGKKNNKNRIQKRKEIKCNQVYQWIKLFYGSM
jgi:hypothetical protein